MIIILWILRTHKFKKKHNTTLTAYWVFFISHPKSGSFYIPMYWVIPYLIHKTPYPYQINIYSLAHKIWEGEKISLYACLNSRQNNPPESNGTPMIICWVSHSWDFHLIKCVATNDQTDYSPYWFSNYSAGAYFEGAVID